MRKNLFKIVTIILSIIFISLVITLISMKVVNGKEKGERELLLSKITEELKFIDYNVIDAMNKINNISITRYKVFNKTVNNKENSNSSESENSSNSGSTSNKGSGEQSEESGGESSGGNSQSGSENKSSSGGKSSSAKSNARSETEKEAELTLVNSLTETDNQEVDWDSITKIYENILSTWPTTQLDLKRAGITDEYLDNINVDLNGIAQSLLNKDKNSSLVNFYNLYSQIPVYMEIISTDTYTINLYNTKMAILNAYSLANVDNKWQEITVNVKSAISYFEKIVNSKNDEKEKINLEKIHSMLKNLESTVALNNRNIFYMQYKNIMQEISNL